MTLVKNPLNNAKDKILVAAKFGKKLAEKLCSTPVYKYDHKSIYDKIGDQRTKLN